MKTRSDWNLIERLLHLQHYVMTLTLGGNHCLCPKNSGAKQVSDLSTGTGIWSVEYVSLPTALLRYIMSSPLFWMPWETNARPESSMTLKKIGHGQDPKWVLLVIESMEKFGRPQWKQIMEAAGFVDVVETIYKWPTNLWPRDQHYK
ncbi:hypothetical protein CTA2_5974 [Colletotrichum tanaceti]|uniref:Uncharacterized protein n=1 Tax=Colletotrichum tanaceti TaxID=1306861 RepID=A0A4U6X9X0_9PEZI|nr:hypothetical protein CTA2_5974 [Colletotrichum tanaceti]TKW52451.1 hypothetical protein CTA1_7697 [Colletotrichum tanaceti]